MKQFLIYPLHHFDVSDSRPLPSKISINNQVSIIKLSEGFEKDAFINDSGDLYSNYDKDQIIDCRYAIQIVCEDTTDQENIKNRVLMGIRLTRPSAICSSGLYQERNGRRTNTYHRIRSSYQDSLYPSGYKSKDLIFLSSDVYDLRRNIRFVLELYNKYAGKYHKVLNSLIFFEDSYRDRLYKPRFILLVSALESLFNSGGSQIKYTFKQRLALFLRDKHEERLEVLNTAGKIYDTRSSFVHGGATQKKIIQNEELSKSLLLSLDSYCRQALNKIVKDDLLKTFNTDKSVDDYFNKMIY